MANYLVGYSGHEIVSKNARKDRDGYTIDVNGRKSILFPLFDRPRMVERKVEEFFENLIAIHSHSDWVVVVPMWGMDGFRDQLVQVGRQSGFDVRIGLAEDIDGSCSEIEFLLRTTFPHLAKETHVDERLDLSFLFSSVEIVYDGENSKMSTWYRPIDDTIKIPHDETVETAKDAMERGVILPEGLVRINHLVVQEKSGEVVGVVTREKLEQFSATHPIRAGTVVSKTLHTKLSACNCVVYLPQVLQFDKEQTPEAIHLAIREKFDVFRLSRAVFITDKGKVIGFATELDIW